MFIFIFYFYFICKKWKYYHFIHREIFRLYLVINNKFLNPMSISLDIKIIEAKIDPSFDFDDKNNLYVTLNLKSQGKQNNLMTNVVKSSHNPIWNQLFSITALNSDDILYINMYHKDVDENIKVMDEICYSIRQLEIHQQSKEREVDIKYQDKQRGKLLLYISNPIYTNEVTNECYIHIYVYDAKKVLKRDRFARSDTYFCFRLKGKESTSQRTDTIPDSTNPIWNQELEIFSNDIQNDILEVDMFHEDIWKDKKMMDTLEIPLIEHRIGEHFIFDDSVTLNRKGAGIIHFELDFLSSKMRNDQLNFTRSSPTCNIF